MKINVEFSTSYFYDDIDVPDGYDCKKDPDGIIEDLVHCFIDDLLNGYIEIERNVFTAEDEEN